MKILYPISNISELNYIIDYLELNCYLYCLHEEPNGIIVEIKE